MLCAPPNAYAKKLFAEAISVPVNVQVNFSTNVPCNTFVPTLIMEAGRCTSFIVKISLNALFGMDVMPSVIVTLTKDIGNDTKESNVVPPK